MNVVKLIILILMLALVSCMPADSARSTSNQSANNNDTTDNSSTTFDGDLNFVLTGQNTTMLGISSDFNDVVYLRGGAVSSFFATQDNVVNNRYCFIANFNNILINPSMGTTASRQLRILMTPSSYFDFAQGELVQIFKIDFTNSASSAANCQGAFSGFDSSLPNQVFYSLSTLCPNCNGLINAQNLYMAKSETTLVTTDTNLINSSLKLSISFSSSSGGGGSGNACTPSNCNQQGYCCDSESASCVQHASPKPDVQTNFPTEYAAAIAAITNDPSAVSNYPQLFYLCPGQNTGGGGNGGSDPGTDVVERIRTDYDCAEEIRANALGSPYQQFLNTNPNSCDVNTPGSCKCDYADPAADLFYISVLERLYDYCNCQGSSATEKFINCPSFYYEVIANDSNGNPSQFQCSPVEVTGFDPNVSVSSHSVPHRFYSTTGQSIDDLTTAAQGTTQEGDEFQYIGTDTYIFPLNNDFNMNSILGSMQIDLSSSRPAQVVNVEQGQSYIIRNNQTSFYIPCPQCASDSWFPPFKAFPTNTIRDGFGLQSFGHTTRRDANEFNNGLGNYEDTIWGRACYVPPTMLPFSQPFSTISPVQLSRQTRLKTQAALFANGYQRDWFGFNLGALIGSFDGVSWFAIGRNRLVQATSDKLYLAINAPFGDLAVSNAYDLSVEPYIPGFPQASEYDFDPNQSVSTGNPLQNMGGSCQRYHICNTDSDCITQLGWEYVCAEADARRTYWPVFTNAQEQSIAPNSRGIVSILQQDGLPSTDTNKRCVYRGAGSVCVQNLETVTDEQLRRSLTCAPNFFCANPDFPVFNREVARFAAPLGELAFLANNHIFGQDANILGRPLHYITGSNLTNLPFDIKQTLTENLFANNTTSSTKVLASAQVGLCRPGKAHAPQGTVINTGSHIATLTSLQAYPTADPVASHSFQNFNFDTDYISQIGTTNINERSASRYLSCPVLSDEGDYLSMADDMVNKAASGIANELMAEFILKSIEQNATGLETLSPASQSPFSSIEAGRLNSGSLVLAPSLVQNACLRRAGAVCHTDLDCSPNRLHEGLVDLFDDSFYGNIAEKNYWSETLVCGQADAKPSPSLSTFETFDIRKNRCCREVGKDITIYTANSVETDSANGGFVLDTTKPGYLNPTAPDRYSRLSSGATALDAFMEPDPVSPPGIVQLLANDGQWESIHEAASRTCCGGGWVRKFTSGNNDWNNPIRAEFNITDFACLNYFTPFARQQASDIFSNFGILTNTTNAQRNLLCDTATDSGSPACIQLNFEALDFATESSPTPMSNFSALTDFVGPEFEYNTQSISISTDPNNLADLSIFTPYKPLLLISHPDGASFTTITNPLADETRIIRLPSYIPPGNSTESIFIPTEGGTVAGTTIINGTPNDPDGNAIRDPFNFKVSIIGLSSGLEFDCGSSNNNFISTPTVTPVGNECSWSYDDQSGGLSVNLTTGTAPFSDVQAGSEQFFIKIYFLAPGMYPYPPEAGAPEPVLGLTPGSPYFYLKRLARMELVGVPQIFHEAIYCNDDSRKLVPGIYRSELYSPSPTAPDRFNPIDNSGIYDAGNIVHFSAVPQSKLDADQNANRYISDYSNLSNAPVFSENEFKCCKKLNSFVQQVDQCCSGYGVQDQQNPGFFQCKLPNKTDVSLYFNRFISGESDGQELIDAGIALSNEDYDSLTGEPLLTEEVTNKLRSLAVNFCESGQWRMGGAFGGFIGEPNVTPKINNQLFGILDSSDDIDTDGATSGGASGGSTKEAGFRAFSLGYRWNHHVYCSDPSDN